MQTPDISVVSLLICSLLLVVPFVIDIILRMRMLKTMVISLARMVVQLLLIGVFLKYLFIINNPWLNIAWLIVMIAAATFNVTNKIKLQFRIFLVPTFTAFMIATLLILLYTMIFVVRVDTITDARFFVVIGGMLLGNSLRGTIIGIDNFYSLLQRNKQRHMYRLALGASVLESLLPYFRSSLTSALQPTLATMATMGIVFLPGMMTGQILGGLSPLLAIKYQMVIMITIFVSTTIAINLTILFTMRTCFDNFGLLKKNTFSDQR